jgi:hypothetical protein
MPYMDKLWWDSWVDDDGSGVVGTIWNKATALEMAYAFDGAVYGASLFTPSPIVVPAGWARISLTDVRFDGGGYASLGGQAQFTIPGGKGGTYQVLAAITWQGTGDVGLNITVAGGSIGVTFANATPNGPAATLSGLAYCSAGTVIELMGYSSVASAIQANSCFSCVRV